MFSDPERRHEKITIQGLKQVFIFYSEYMTSFANVSLLDN